MKLHKLLPAVSHPDGADAADVLRLDDQEAARSEPPRERRERRHRVGEVLEHIPQGDDVDRLEPGRPRPGELAFEDRDGGRRRHACRRPRAVESSDCPAALARRYQEVTPPAPDIEEASDPGHALDPGEAAVG